MDKTKILSIATIVIVAIVLLAFVIFQRNTTSQKEINSGNSQNSSVAEDTKENTGRYQKYSKENLVQASDKTVVLFYKATWCPSCKALDRDIQTNLDSIPNDVLILDVAYDEASGATEEELELVERNDVTYQHTLMVVDQEGNKTRDVISGTRLSQVLDDLKK